MTTDTDLLPAELEAQQAFDADQKAEQERATAAAEEARRAAEEEARANDPIEQERTKLAAERAEFERLRTEAAETQRQAQEALAAAQAAQQAAAQQQQPATRDFDAEINTLEEQYEAGELTRAEFRDKERALLREQAQHDAATEAAERQRAEAAQAATQSWEQATGAFFADPGNAELGNDPIKLAALNAAVKLVYEEKGGQISYPDLLVAARERVTGVKAVDPQEAIRKAQFERQQQGGDPADTLRDVPNSGALDASRSAQLDDLPIDQLEDALARMSEADRAKFRASAPGGVHDNPRG